MVCRLTTQPAAELLPHEKKSITKLTDHVVVVGFGVNGQNLARVLKASNIPYVILEQGGQNLRRGRLAGEPIYFGDGTRREVLERVGLSHARVIVYAISSPADERRGAVSARLIGPNVKIIVRTRLVSEVGELLALGADEVIPAEFETSIEIFSRVLRMYGVPGNVIQAEMLAVRGEHYEMLRTPTAHPPGLTTLQHLEVQDMLTTLRVEESCRAIGGSPVSLELRQQTGITVIAVIRDGVALHAPDPTFGFRAGDTVVLVGDRAATEMARDIFRSNPGRKDGDGPQLSS